MTGVVEWISWAEAQIGPVMRDAVAHAGLLSALGGIATMAAALISRDLYAIALTALVNLLALAFAWGTIPDSGGLGRSACMIAAVAFGFVGFRERARRQGIRGVALRLEQIETQLATFLRAVDARTQILDERAENARKHMEHLSKLLSHAQTEAKGQPGPELHSGPRVAAPTQSA